MLELPYVIMGTARLPAGALGEKPSPLMIELAFDRAGGRIVGVATNIPLPGYNRLLEQLLMGTSLGDVDTIAERFSTHSQGALVKPTVAALANAVAQVQRRATSV